MLREKSNYKILSLVGRGQFGRVYAAIERKTGMLVALKELKIKQLSTSSFLRELTFIVTLDHFNIVTCKALEHRQNQRYLVMDYCEGGTLRDLIDRQTKLDLTQSLQLTIDVLRGLEFAHNKGIIHRDIKPANILLKSSSRGYSAHIADFGIAQLHQRAEDPGVLGNTGSPAYMAPEQFYGDYSFNCDLYGLGIILYELVVGERPFLGMPKDLLPAHLSRTAVIPEDIPLAIRMAIAKALRKFPQYRFQSAAEMRQSLELALKTIEPDLRAETPVQIRSSFVTLVADAHFDYDARIVHFATASERVYLGTSENAIVRCDLDSESSAVLELAKTIFEEPIYDLQLNPSGCLVTTAGSLYYQSYSEASEAESFVPIATFLTEKVVASVNPQGSWLAVSYLAKDRAEGKVKIYRLPQGKLVRSLVNCPIFDCQISLDSRYAIGMSRQDRSTKFQLFDRRGNWLANFTVQILITTAVCNPLFSDRLLAREAGNSNTVISIELKKFNLKRIQLEIEPTLITACPLGYLVSDRQGRIIVLDLNGESVCKFQVSLLSGFEVTAISVSDSQLLIASANSIQSQLQRFAWSKITSLQ